MTISNQQIRANYTGDNSSTSFPIPFPFYLATDIDVLLAGVTQTSGYTISGGVDASGNPQPGTCVFASAPATATPVLLLLNVPLTQLVQLVDGTAFQSATLNQVNDRAVQALLRVQDLLSRAIVAPDGDVSPGMSLPPAASRAGLFLTFDGAGNLLLASAGPGTNNTQSTLGPVVNPLSTSENSQGLIPVPANQVYPVLDSRRYALDTTGSADVTVTLQKILDTAGAAALDGQVRIVVLQPGTYKVRRLYMHYSNVWLCLMPGATIIQTLTGITNNNTAGVAPAYAIIHINPLTYVTSPSSAVTAISNVRIYGGGTIQGPNIASPGSYQQYQLGIVANDCNKCWVIDIQVQGCGAESILMGNSSWNTCTDYRIIGNEIIQGGEWGVNNGRNFLILNNYYHDNWFQNGMGANGDGGIAAFNRLINLVQAAFDVGGSGARDINACRNILITNNYVHNTGLGGTTFYQAFFTDDGATTTPKNNIQIISNIFDAHTGPISVVFDYNSGTVDFSDNIITGNTTAGATGADFNVIAGSATYRLKGNRMTPGVGNSAYGVTISSAGTPAIYINSENDIFGHGIANINYSAAIKTAGSQSVPLTGVTGGATTVTWQRVNGVAFLSLSAFTAASSGTGMTLSIAALPQELLPSRSFFFQVLLEDNTANVNGYLQIAPNGTVTFYKDQALNSAGWTPAGTKGIPQQIVISYPTN